MIVYVYYSDINSNVVPDTHAIMSFSKSLEKKKIAAQVIKHMTPRIGKIFHNISSSTLVSQVTS